ncbi:UNVERIFIED_CONTAM: hypothetical protein FKN15_076271 [Acipenser sinensis]
MLVKKVQYVGKLHHSRHTVPVLYLCHFEMSMSNLRMLANVTKRSLRAGRSTESVM